MTTPQNPLELAKQGNPKAIGFLINRSLQSKGITANVDKRDNLLQIILESNEVPKQQELVALLQESLTNLQAKSIDQVTIYGKQRGEEIPFWSETFFLLDVGTSTLDLNDVSAQPVYQLKSSSIDPLNSNPYSNKRNLTPQKENILNINFSYFDFYNNKFLVILTGICSLIMLPWSIVSLGLAFIPANMARNKGKDFTKWWCYGALIFIVAIIHAALLEEDHGLKEQRALREGMKKCSFCAEIIKSEARVCRYCGRDVTNGT